MRSALVAVPGAAAGSGAVVEALAHRGPSAALVGEDHSLLAVGRAELVRAAGAQGPLQLVFDGPSGSVGLLREELIGAGAWLEAEAGPGRLLLQAISAATGATLLNRLIGCLYRLRGPWALAGWLGPGRGLLAARDPLGLRPLWLGRGDLGWGVATESQALAAAGLEPVRPLQPGELALLGAELQCLRPFPLRTPQPCLVELLVGLRLDARRDAGGTELADGWTVQHTLGEALATSRGASCELVVAVPGAEGLAAGFARGRPVVVPWTAGPRAARGAVQGRQVALLALQAEGAGPWIQALRSAGARAVHLRVALPEASAPCPHGLGEEQAEGARPAHLPPPAGVDSFKTLLTEELHAGLQPWAPTVCSGCRGGTLANAEGVAPARAQLPLFRGS